ncbi:hypothetical protein UPYG_G00197220 [Umbra pygmaea]|uniref:Sushi domain-containing protein n=1 Tax=Umbra pygmaea TaxID=75934 RepID=A0ABD0X1L2_UMBPY
MREVSRFLSTQLSDDSSVRDSEIDLLVAICPFIWKIIAEFQADRKLYRSTALLHIGLILGPNIPLRYLDFTGKSVLMSARVLCQWLCGHLTLGYGLFLFVVLPDFTTGRQKNCTHPLVPEHGGFRCDPSPCRGFPQKSSIQYFCEPGYSMPSRVHRSRCHRGEWTPSVPPCLPMRDNRVNNDERASHSLPSVATTAVGVSIFLLTTTACMVIKSRLYPCHSNRRRSSDQLDLMVDGVPVLLPTYEEAIYGSWGQRMPPCSGPTQLLLAQEAPGPSLAHNQSDFSHRIPLTSQSPEMPPPPYEEIHSRPRDGQNDGDIQALQVALSDDKDV